MKRHYLPNETLARIEPEQMGLKYTSAQRIDVNGKSVIKSGAEEVCAIVISGDVAWSIDDKDGRAQTRDMLYIPINHELTIESNEASIVYFGAPCARATEFKHIAFADVDSDARHKVYGTAEAGTLRDVWNFIDEDFDSSRFLVGLCQGRNGGWTAWPPHEHGMQREEVYIYFGMGDGFGVQCVYDDMDAPIDAAIVRDGHLLSIPGGYHPNVGCPKGGISYAYCMVSVNAEQRSFMDLKTQAIYGDKLE